MIYLDTSAFVKLVWAEPETGGLREFLAGREDRTLISSTLLSVETRRAVLREDPSHLARADLLLTGVGQVGVSPAVAEAASRFPEPNLRSLDAIHLATALLIGDQLEALVTYDRRLAAAASARRVAVVAPTATTGEEP